MVAVVAVVAVVVAVAEELDRALLWEEWGVVLPVRWYWCSEYWGGDTRWPDREVLESGVSKEESMRENGSPRMELDRTAVEEGAAGLEVGVLLGLYLWDLWL